LFFFVLVRARGVYVCIFSAVGLPQMSSNKRTIEQVDAKSDEVVSKKQKTTSEQQNNPENEVVIPSTASMSIETKDESAPVKTPSLPERETKQAVESTPEPVPESDSSDAQQEKKTVSGSPPQQEKAQEAPPKPLDMIVGNQSSFESIPSSINNKQVKIVSGDNDLFALERNAKQADSIFLQVGKSVENFLNADGSKMTQDQLKAANALRARMEELNKSYTANLQKSLEMAAEKKQLKRAADMWKQGQAETFMKTVHEMSDLFETLNGSEEDRQRFLKNAQRHPEQGIQDFMIAPPLVQSVASARNNASHLIKENKTLRQQLKEFQDKAQKEAEEAKEANKAPPPQANAAQSSGDPQVSKQTEVERLKAQLEQTQREMQQLQQTSEIASASNSMDKEADRAAGRGIASALGESFKGIDSRVIKAISSAASSHDEPRKDYFKDFEAKYGNFRRAEQRRHEDWQRRIGITPERTEQARSVNVLPVISSRASASSARQASQPIGSAQNSINAQGAPRQNAQSNHPASLTPQPEPSKVADQQTLEWEKECEELKRQLALEKKKRDLLETKENLRKQLSDAQTQNTVRPMQPDTPVMFKSVASASQVKKAMANNKPEMFGNSRVLEGPMFQTPSSFRDDIDELNVEISYSE